jgi:hypothetical protein
MACLAAATGRIHLIWSFYVYELNHGSMLDLYKYDVFASCVQDLSLVLLRSLCV